MMNMRQTKTLLMFAPLALMFAGVGLWTYDIKHPSVQTHQCEVLGKGLSANRLRTGDNLLYVSSGQPLHDLGLRCASMGVGGVGRVGNLNEGVVVLNDYDVWLTDINKGDTARLTHRTYRWLPERWNVDVTRQPAK